MIQLKIHGHNTVGDSCEYTCQNLYFQNFHIGRKRDGINLKVIRRYAEGDILLKGVDFDNLKDYFFSQQDAQFYVNEWQWCIIDFSNPNYLTKTISVNLIYIDQYSLPFDGLMINSWYNEFYEPFFTKALTAKEIREHSGALSSAYVDGSQNRYNPSDNLWYREYMNAVGDKNVTLDDIFKWNSGGCDIDNLIPISVYAKDNYFKPYSIIYTNPSGSTYRHFDMSFVREIRYFPDSEEVSEEWFNLNSAKTVNDIVYWKYTKFYGGKSQTYFSGKQVYYIKDEHLAYGRMTVTYKGFYSDLQDSPNFVKLNDLLKRLTYKVFNYINIALDTDMADTLYIATLKSYNNFENWDDAKFKLSDIVDYLRDRHGVYISVTDTISFKNLSFPNKYLDIDNYKTKNWYLNNSVKLSESENIYEYKSKSDKLDFKDVTVNFFGTKKILQSVSGSVVTDCEILTNEPDSYVLIDTQIGSANQINRPFTYIGDPPTYDGDYVKRGEDGSFVSWNLGSGTLELFSNDIYFDYPTYTAHISYYVKIYSGAVKVEIGNYTGFHTASGSVSTSFSGSGKDNVKITIGTGGSMEGNITNLSISVVSKTPKTQTGLITGIKKKNAILSLPQVIINDKPLMSYPRGSMEKIGIIDCNTKYSKEIDFIIPLDEEIFGMECFEKYMELDGEKWIVFERKRQILTNQNGEAVISKYDKIKCKSNDIY